MPTCEAIKTDGIPCNVKAKNGLRCGTHSNHAATPAEYRSYLVNRIHYIYRLSNTIQTLDNQTLLGMNMAELLDHIRVCEIHLRTKYTWEGNFAHSHRHAIRNTRILTNRDRAVDRVPLIVRHQVGLLADWFTHFKNTVQIAFQEIGFVAEITEDDVYNPEYITDILRPVLIESWAQLSVNVNNVLHRCFHNMGILGQREIGDLGNVLAPPVPVVRAVATFIQDTQNVHRTETVKYVTETYEKLTKIQIPSEQNTLAEIILHCKLGPRAIVMLATHYCDPVSIYEIKNAYPKALDGVWAYVRSHPEKTELYQRVKDELTDNVGMCAQGNLSRLCNILSGYLDGIQPPISQGELIQQKISAIALDKQGNKIGRARDALRQLKVPETEWEPWIDALDSFA